MQTEFEEKMRKKELAEAYYSKLRQAVNTRHAKLTEEERTLIDRRNEKLMNELQAALQKEDIVPSEYLKKHDAWIFEKLIPSSFHEMIFRHIDHIREFPYGTSYSRRSYRGKSYALYASRILQLVQWYIFEPFTEEIPLENILNREVSKELAACMDLQPYHQYYRPEQVAYELDRHNEKVEEAITRILTEENNSSLLTHNLIEGILYSHRTDFHELLGKLLLAAKLQEGLRQAICEKADEGTREGFLTILSVIDEHNLIRFSSVKRAVGTWLGLLTEESRDLERISGKSVSLMLDCLQHNDLRTEYLTSDDAMKLYIALWSIGFEYSLEDSFREIARIAAYGTKIQCLTAGYFLCNANGGLIPHHIAMDVILQRGEDDEIFVIWVHSIFPNRAYRFESKSWETYFRSKDEAYRFAELLETKRNAFPKKEKIFSPILFPWLFDKLQKSVFAELYCLTAACLNEQAMLEHASTLIPYCSSDSRHLYFNIVLQNPKGEILRGAVLAGLADKESYTRREAMKKVQSMQLSDEEYRKLESYLRFKADDIRNNVITLLFKQEDTDLKESIYRLLNGEKEEIRLGGLDILTRLKADEKRSYLIQDFLPMLSVRLSEDEIPAKEKILLETFFPKEKGIKEEKEVYIPDLDAALSKEAVLSALRTFMECFPDSKIVTLLSDPKNKKGLLSSIKGLFDKNTVCPSAKEAADDLKSLAAYIEENRMTPIKTAYGEELLLGEANAWQLSYQSHSDFMPGVELWNKWITDNGITNGRLLRMAIFLHAVENDDSYSKEAASDIRAIFGQGFEIPINIPHLLHMILIIRYFYFYEKLTSGLKETLAVVIGMWFMRCVPDDRVMLEAPPDKVENGMKKAHILAHPQLLFLFEELNCENGETFSRTFPLAVAVADRCIEATKSNVKAQDAREVFITAYPAHISDRRLVSVNYRQGQPRSCHLVGTKAYLKAAYEGIITKHMLLEFIFRPSVLPEALNLFSKLVSAYCERGRIIAGRGYFAKFSAAYKANALTAFIGHEGNLTEEDEKLLRFTETIYEAILPGILESEYRRGDSPAEYSHAIPTINRIYGTKEFVRILHALGNDSLNRSGYYYGMGTRSRSDNLAHLLSVCIPYEKETADDLREVLKDKKISEKRLIEAAFYSAEWIPMIGEYLEIPAFESVCYYFIAHMNERFDDKRKAVIARYTPLEEEELNLGAFDRNWFYAAYEAVGEKRFMMIYDAAKYISDGAKHARARKFADACLGKYEISEMEKTISDKRNKDLLMAYALLPSDGEDDIFRRYLFLEKFRKESRTFGSQRMASEGKAVETAKKNLAFTAGYSDDMRLTLRMETKLMDDNRALLEPQEIDGIILTLFLDESGKAEILVTKDGKELKSVPAKLKKHEIVLALTAFKKTLTEQYRRTKKMLEEAMENGTAFTMREISELCEHPVVYPMLQKLVFLCESENESGFPINGGLTDAKGVFCPLAEDEALVIAHPSHLFKRGIWREYQACLFEKQIKQPFRQVFRELYIKTEDEKGKNESLRYVGNQIQPKKTLAALKSRRWVADIEDGLQKVYYKENIVARIYALADWFSPADIEAPTLEWVCFEDRKTGQSLPIDEIPDVIFSEVMRDVDLAVSVAHAGGVDPEASHSTIEMREAILSFALPLFGVKNVTFENQRAVIKGTLADYTVHLGSGVVHQLGAAMIPVLPVHSQHKGRIFLPFVDDDPKTAEIISKILFFADDQSIQDPGILSLIVRA